MSDTKEKILQVTQRLILEHGWHRVTFRMITKEAGVNLAAINYHFGSREALETELIPRIVGPMDEARLVALREAEERAAPELPDLETVLRCLKNCIAEWYRYWGQVRPSAPHSPRPQPGCCLNEHSDHPIVPQGSSFGSW